MDKIQEGCTSGIILNEKGQTLFTRRADDEDFLPRVWELPGGGIEYGESPQDGLKREIKEECGIDVEVIKPVSAGSYMMHGIHRIEITFLCKARTTDVKLNSEHSDYKWLNTQDLDSIEVTDHVRKIIDSYEKQLAQ